MSPMSSERHKRFADIGYLPGGTVADYLDKCQANYPSLYDRISLDRVFANRGLYQRIDSMSRTFEGSDKGGRGDSYRKTQLKYPLVRAVGIKALFELIAPSGGVPASHQYVLDVLGGNGTLTRTMRLVTPPERLPNIFTSDIAGSMVIDALAQGFPAVRQPAQSLLLADETMDGIIFAYGTHHVPMPDRPTALAEAYRVLRPGGRVLVQDFIENSRTARWYSEFLDKYTLTGHDHVHFTEPGIRMLLEKAGFDNVRVMKVYDPFIFRAANADEAWMGLLRYLLNLFSLEKLQPRNGQADPDHWKLVHEIIIAYAEHPADDDTMSEHQDPIKVYREDSSYVAEFPRVALVATGDRSA